MLFLDLNGTIIDDWDSFFVGVSATFKHYGVKCPSLEECIRIIASSGDYLEFYRKYGITSIERDDLYKIYAPAYYAHKDDVKLIPHVYKTLEYLKNSGVEIHIVTAARKDLAEYLIYEANLEQYCDGIHFHVHNKQAQVKAIIDGLDISPEECAMMGDLPSDVAHAKNAGIKGIAFLNKHVPRDVFSELHDMDYATPYFNGLLDFILNQK